MMSLGIDRSKFGDIHLDGDDEVQFTVANELKDYMTANFISIGKAKVTVEEVKIQKMDCCNMNQWTEEMHIS